jgi:hypothetical protein
MHPRFTEILAKQHMEQLRCEALAERNAAGLEAHSRGLEAMEHAAFFVRLLTGHVARQVKNTSQTPNLDCAARELQ